MFEEIWLQYVSFSSEGNVRPRDDVTIIKHGLKIPNNAPAYENFVHDMQVSEQEFKTIVASLAG